MAIFSTTISASCINLISWVPAGIRQGTPTNVSVLLPRTTAVVGGLRVAPDIQISMAGRTRIPVSRRFKTTISCSVAEVGTLEVVQGVIAKQLLIEEKTVKPETKFADLGADSLDTVEIMMALEEKFGVSIGEGGAENITTVQDAANLIEKVKSASSNE